MKPTSLFLFTLSLLSTARTGSLATASAPPSHGSLARRSASTLHYRNSHTVGSFVKVNKRDEHADSEAGYEAPALGHESGGGKEEHPAEPAPAPKEAVEVDDGSWSAEKYPASSSSSDYGEGGKDGWEKEQKGYEGGGGSVYDSCVQQCLAAGGMSWPSPDNGGEGNKTADGGEPAAPPAGEGGEAPAPVPAPAGGNGTEPAPVPAGANVTELVPGPGQVVVAPKPGDLRMVPFNLIAKPGEKVEFVWNAGPHTVTQSSALTICNASKAEGAFKSGMQNAGFRFDVEVKDDKPIWYYCTVNDHCLKGMFGVINAPVTDDPKKQFGGVMEDWGKQDKANQIIIQQTIEITKDSVDEIKNWGSSFDSSQFEEWALPYAMEATLATRQYYAKQPDLLIANSSSSPPSSSSNSSSPSSSDSSPTAAGNSASASRTASAEGQQLESGAAFLFASSSLTGWTSLLALFGMAFVALLA
ncbi:hypothetical protein JCM11251_005538 [Rhodosporidiobolus azoricus]